MAVSMVQSGDQKTIARWTCSDDIDAPHRWDLLWGPLVWCLVGLPCDIIL